MRGVTWVLMVQSSATRKAHITGSQSIIQRFSSVDTVTATSRLSRRQTSSVTSPSLVQPYFYAGRIPRAPQWLREMGLEWLYQLYQEPGRMWRRYLLGNVGFLYRVLMERLWTDPALARSAGL
jgi:hypothetical protein